MLCLKKPEQPPLPSQKLHEAKAKLSLFPKACSKTTLSLLLFTQETSVAEKLVCAYTQSFTLPLPFLMSAMVGISQRTALVFPVLLATRLLGKHLKGSCPGHLWLLC